MNTDNKTTRELAIGWFNSKASLEKTRLCDTNTEIVGTVRRWETLTGREIEQIYLSEHPTQPEQTIKEEWQIDKDGVGNLCVWKNKTKIAAIIIKENVPSPCAPRVAVVVAVAARASLIKKLMAFSCKIRC
mgnify:CR=1 FL=1